MKVYSDNEKAYFNYNILEKFEAGLVLLGTEVKSIRLGKATIKGSYIIIKDDEAYLTGATIPPYQPKNAPPDYDPQRPRKLLLERQEINYLVGKSKESGIAVVPLKIFDKNAKIKIEIGVGKGKKKYDKRQTIKKRETERELKREINIRG